MRDKNRESGGFIFILAEDARKSDISNLIATPFAPCIMIDSVATHTPRAAESGESFIGWLSQPKSRRDESSDAYCIAHRIIREWRD